MSAMKWLLPVGALFAIGQLSIVHDCECTLCDRRPKESKPADEGC